MAKTQREIFDELENIHNNGRREVCGIPVSRLRGDFRAELPNGTISGWWGSWTMATIIDSWQRREK